MFINSLLLLNANVNAFHFLKEVVEVSLMHVELRGNCREDVGLDLARESGCVVDHRHISQALSPQLDASHPV